MKSDGGGGLVPVTSKGPHKVPLFLAIHPRPTGDASAFTAGRHSIVVAVTARDTDAAFYRLDVSFDGLWGPAAEIRDHLKVSQPTRTRETAF